MDTVERLCPHPPPSLLQPNNKLTRVRERSRQKQVVGCGTMEQDEQPPRQAMQQPKQPRQAVQAHHHHRHQNRHHHHYYHYRLEGPPDGVAGTDDHYAYVMLCTEKTENSVFKHSVFAGRKANPIVTEGVRIVLYNVNARTLHLNCTSSSNLCETQIVTKAFPDRLNVQVRVDMDRVGWVLLPDHHRGYVEGCWMSRPEYESYLLRVPWEEAPWFHGSQTETVVAGIRARQRAFQAGRRAVVQKKFAQMRQQRLAFARLQAAEKKRRANFAERRRQKQVFRLLKKMNGGGVVSVPQ